MGRLKKTLVCPILDNNPITLQVLGICSALAVTSQLKTSLVMSLAVIFVVSFSNLFVSFLRNHIPFSMRIIIEMTIIASLVIIVDQLIKAFFFDISRQLSVYVGLIITNCIILGRAEAFASKNRVLYAIADAVGASVGFMLALVMISFFRQMLGTGEISVFDVELFQLPVLTEHPMIFFVLPSGAFLVIGLLLALFKRVGVLKE